MPCRHAEAKKGALEGKRDRSEGCFVTKDNKLNP